jgi:hypothetical protein
MFNRKKRDLMTPIQQEKIYDLVEKCFFPQALIFNYFSVFEKAVKIPNCDFSSVEDEQIINKLTTVNHLYFNNKIKDQNGNITFFVDDFLSVPIGEVMQGDLILTRELIHKNLHKIANPKYEEFSPGIREANPFRVGSRSCPTSSSFIDKIYMQRDLRLTMENYHVGLRLFDTYKHNPKLEQKETYCGLKPGFLSL